MADPARVAVVRERVRTAWRRSRRRALAVVREQSPGSRLDAARRRGRAVARLPARIGDRSSVLRCGRVRGAPTARDPRPELAVSRPTPPRAAARTANWNQRLSLLRAPRHGARFRAGGLGRTAAGSVAARSGREACGYLRHLARRLHRRAACNALAVRLSSCGHLAL